MPKRTIFFFASAASLLLAGCGVTNPREQVVYPHSKPIPRAAHAEQRTSCPGDAEELAPGSICPPSAQCFEIYGGRRCIVYER
ncbi:MULTISPECIES: hypothetical protein [unclassified Microbulbifer]|uniref:hypothetical protein n=1 Tax=unclassified Microbulbifer TaxID=2619833 RepID=UPI0027E5AB8A|nr:MULTISPECIES: hypothetical protein [unclassified Microbulbifer]